MPRVVLKHAPLHYSSSGTSTLHVLVNIISKCPTAACNQFLPFSVIGTLILSHLLCTRICSTFREFLPSSLSRSRPLLRAPPVPVSLTVSRATRQKLPSLSLTSPPLLSVSSVVEHSPCIHTSAHRLGPHHPPDFRSYGDSAHTLAGRLAPQLLGLGLASVLHCQLCHE